MENGMRRVNVFVGTLIPQTRLTYAALVSSYASGAPDTNFIDVLSSIQTMLDFELELIEVKRDLHLAAADLEMTLGGPWADKGMPAPTIAPFTPPEIQLPPPAAPEGGAPGQASSPAPDVAATSPEPAAPASATSPASPQASPANVVEAQPTTREPRSR
jgi:hypothetical protein